MRIRTGRLRRLCRSGGNQAPGLPTDLATDCQGYWLLNGDGTDESPNARTLGHDTLAYSATGPGGQQYARNGTGDTVLSLPLTAGSVQCWFAFSGAPLDVGFTICGFRLATVYNLGVTCTNPNRIAQSYMDGAGQGGYTEIAAGPWHHVVVTATASDSKVYVDGFLRTTTVGFTPFTADEFQIDADSTGQKVGIAVVGCWSKVLNLAEVLALYNAGTPVNPFA